MARWRRLGCLWHLRGKKRIWVYPASDTRFASQEDLEGIYLGETEEEIPYREEFDEHAEIVDIEPGDFITWPQNSPHRVVNLTETGEIALSLNTEHYTATSRRRLAVYMANGWFRRRFGLDFRSTEIHGPVAIMKAATMLAIKKLGLMKVDEFQPVVDFRLDPSAPEGIVDVPPHPKDDRDRAA